MHRIASRAFHGSCKRLKHPLGLSAQTVALVKATAPVLAEHGYAITRTMYKNMFRECPHVKEMFNQAHQAEIRGDKAHQPMTLACSVHAYAQYIDDPLQLTPAIMRIAHKHVSLNVIAPQYDVVGAQLLRAVKEVLGDAATPAVMAAWGEAYPALAKVFIDVEESLKKQGRDQVGGWEGWRDFVIKEKIRDSSIIQSFILAPKDGKKVPLHKPGQYVGLNAHFGGVKTTRNYTISCKPNNETWRLTIKREPAAEPGAPEGVISSYLHDKAQVGDVVQLSVPCGDFCWDSESKRPVALISGGVGLTPNLSILEHMVSTGAQQHITFVLGVRNSEVEPMHEYLTKLRRKNLNVKVKFIYDNPPTPDYPAGPVTIDQIKQAIPHKDSDYYICGPRVMMTTVVKELRNWGVPEAQIKYEFFGPQS